MHELAIAHNLIERAVSLLPAESDAATKPQVVAVHVKLGALAGLSPADLRLGFDAMAAATPCAGARLDIVAQPAQLRCRDCGAETIVTSDAEDDDLSNGEIHPHTHDEDEPHTHSPVYAICGSCGSPHVEVLQGKDLQLMGIEIET